MTNLRKRVLWVLGLVALALLLGACGGGNKPQNTLNPQGPNAAEIKNLFVPVFWVAVAVFVIVEGGIVLILIKYRHRKSQNRFPPQMHGNTRLEIGWTILPALVLAVVMVPTVATIWTFAAKPPAGAMHVTVQGHQWWWGFQYTDADMTTAYGDKGPITVADVMVIPVGRPVYLSLESVANGAHDDQGVPDYQVIHSFWVPELAGKQDVVPGRTNHILLSADHAGTFSGQCAEFCGLQHGEMKFRVVALSQSDWDAWVANEKQPAVTPTGGLASQGMGIFLNPLNGTTQTCVACHAIGGTQAAAIAAPNLTHFAAPSHQCFAGCDWNTSDTAALEAWLRDPNAVKLGAKMPDYHLTDGEIQALVAYLQSLK